MARKRGPAKPNEIDRHLGMRVRVRRKSIKMSMDDLAAELKLTYQQVQKYEKGANRIPASRLHELGQILRVPVSYFYHGLSVQLEDQNTEFSYSEREQRVCLLEAFDNISNDGLRQAIVQLMSDLSNACATKSNVIVLPLKASSRRNKPPPTSAE